MSVIKKLIVSTFVLLMLCGAVIPNMAHAYVFQNELELGAHGPEVVFLQQVLRDLGFFDPPINDGLFGPITKAAVQKFQSAKGIASSASRGYGRVGPKTLAVLNSIGENTENSTLATGTAAPLVLSRDLYVGSRGEDVKQLQTFLESLGFYKNNRIDGSFGPITKAAVIAFQKANGINPIGRVGPQTRAKIAALSVPVLTIPVPPLIPSPIVLIHHGSVHHSTTSTPGIIDSTAPIISETTPVSTPTDDSSPDYAFTSDEAGTITYGGDCSSATNVASVGLNAITFSVLSDGVHSNCTLSVTDSASNESNVISISPFSVDATAPIRSNDSPSGTLALGTTSTTISLSTNETALCKYSTSPGTAYGSMTAFSTTNSTSHSSSVSGLSNGGSYMYYVKCADILGNTNATDFTISFTVAADTTAPAVSISTPANNAVVHGSTVSVSATASDDVGVLGVQFKRDTSTNIGTEDTSSPYGVSWDSTGVSDGAHTLAAVARDAAGNITTSSIISVTVDNTGPIVSITAPGNGATVGGSAVTLSATASDADAVAGVTFKIGGVTVGTEDTTFPYSILWDSTGAPDGSKTVTAVARDSSGNLTTSSGVSFTVDNTAPIISATSSGTPGETTATITWSTNENSNSQVDYGLTSGYGSTTTLDPTLTTSHSVGLTALTASTIYHYRVRSADPVGNVSVSGDQTFTTTIASWVPAASGNLADSFADYSTEGGSNHYWSNGASRANADAYFANTNSSFTRSSPGYYVNSLGRLASAVMNALRIDYDPVSLVPRGLLLEGTATNLVFPSESGLVNWTKNNVTVTDGATTAPDGTTTAIKVVESASTAFHSIFENANYNIISVFAKAGERNFIWLDAFDGSDNITWFDLGNGTVGTNASGNTATIVAYPNGWYLCTIRRASSTLANFGIASGDNVGSYAGDNTKGVYMWGMDARQIDDGTLDSYIKTTAPTSPSLIGYWKMDESGTGTRADATGNGLTLTNNNNVTNGTGLLNNASAFTRSSSMSLSHADAPGLHPGGSSFGISTWVKFNSFADYEDIVSKWTGVTANNEFTLEADSTGHVGFYVSSSSGVHSVTWGPALSTGTWYNIVVWYDISTGKVGIAVNNGTPVLSSSFSGTINNTGTARFEIGAADTSSWNSYVDGLVDETAYFTGSPSESDLTFIYGGGTPPAYSSWPVVAGAANAIRASDFLVHTLGGSPVAVTKVVAARTPKTLPTSGSAQILYHMDDGTENNDFEVYRDSNGHIIVEVHSGAEVSQGALDMGFVPNDTDLKVALRGQTNDLAASLNGGAVLSDTSVTWPTTFTTERWGVNIYTLPRNWNSTVKSDATFLSAVSDADLQSLSQ